MTDGPTVAQFPPPASDMRYTAPQCTGLLHRGRLTEVLDGAVARHRITVVTAPSGYGKTAAVAEWARRSSAAVAWLSLTRFDDDPAALSDGIITALRRCAHGMSTPQVFGALAIVTEAGAAERYRAVCIAMHEAPDAMVLVIDDVHRAAGAVREGVLGALLEQGPEKLHIVLIGRNPDQLPLAGAILSGSAVQLTTAELRFTATEVMAVATANGWTDTEARSLCEQTGGWASAVRLAMLTGVGRHADDRARYEPTTTDTLLLAAIADDVLGTLPVELAAFIQNVTTLSDLDPALAIGLSGRDDAVALLEECRRRGLFLDRFGDDDAPHYRWHSVFAQRCRRLTAMQNPARARELHRTAARLLAERNPLLATTEALFIGDHSNAHRILVESWLLLLAGRSDESPERVLARLPEPFASRADVLAISACAIDMAGRRTEAQVLLESIILPDGAVTTHSTEWRTHLTTGCARLLLCDSRTELLEAMEEVRRHLGHAQTLGPARYAALQLLLGRTHLSLRHDMPTAIALLTSAEKHAIDAGEAVLARRAAGMLAFCQAWVGDFTAAQTVLDRVDGDNAPTDAWATQIGSPEVAARGWIAYWTGDFVTARTMFWAVVQARTGTAGFHGIACQYLAFLAVLDGDARQRRDVLALVRDIPDRQVRGLPWHLYRTTALAMLAEAEGDRTRAGTLIRSIRGELREAPAAAAIAVELIRRHIGRNAAAATVRQLASTPVPSYVRVSLMVTSALINRSEGDYEAAHEVLERALHLAAPMHIARPFLEPDATLADLLTEHCRWGTAHSALIAGLAAPCLATHTLTRREREILGYLRTTMTLTEIADELGLSINTIKTHTRSLYRKLEVPSRRAAVDIHGR